MLSLQVYGAPEKIGLSYDIVDNELLKPYINSSIMFSSYYAEGMFVRPTGAASPSNDHYTTHYVNSHFRQKQDTLCWH